MFEIPQEILNGSNRSSKYIRKSYYRFKQFSLNFFLLILYSFSYLVHWDNGPRNG
jgi:hypothetical protein